MKTKTKKPVQTVESKAFQKKLEAMKPGDKLLMRRGECTLTFIRDDFGVIHHFGRGHMHYSVSFRQAADWFTEDDGKGPWDEVKE